MSVFYSSSEDEGTVELVPAIQTEDTHREVRSSPTVRHEPEIEGTKFWIKPTSIGLNDHRQQDWEMDVLIQPNETGNLPSKESAWSILASASNHWTMLSVPESPTGDAKKLYDHTPIDIVQYYEEIIRNSNKDLLERNGWELHVHRPDTEGQLNWEELERSCIRFTPTYHTKVPWIGVEISKTKFHEGQVAVVLSDEMISHPNFFSFGKPNRRLNNETVLPPDFENSTTGAEYLQDQVYNILSWHPISEDLKENGNIKPVILETIKTNLEELSGDLKVRNLLGFTFDIYDGSSEGAARPLRDLRNLTSRLTPSPKVETAFTESQVDDELGETVASGSAQGDGKLEAE